MTARLAERLGLPVLRLDDFYRDGDDPSLPRITTGANAGLVDWDDPDSWLGTEAVVALGELCRTGRVETPVYDIPTSARTIPWGWKRTMTAPIIPTVERLTRKGGREVVARSPSRDDAEQAGTWLVDEGWRMYRFTKRQVYGEPDEIAATIGRALGLR